MSYLFFRCASYIRSASGLSYYSPFRLYSECVGLVGKCAVFYVRGAYRVYSNLDVVLPVVSTLRG